MIDDLAVDYRVTEATVKLTDLEPGTRLRFPPTSQPVIHLILSNVVTLLQGDWAERAERGDVVLVQHGDEHSIATEGAGINEERTIDWSQAAAWHRSARPPSLSAAASILSFKVQLNFLPAAAKSVRIFDPVWISRRKEDDPAGRALGLDLDQVRFLTSGPGAEVFLNNLASLLYVHGLRVKYRKIWGDGRGQFSTDDRRRIASAVMAIEKHPERDWTVEDLARHVGCSRSTFAQAFRQAIGETPYQFLKRQRMERARRLLEGSSLAIDEIARRFGYPRRASFSRAFADFYGIAPTRVRNPTRVKTC